MTMKLDWYPARSKLGCQGVRHSGEPLVAGDRMHSVVCPKRDTCIYYLEEYPRKDSLMCPGPLGKLVAGSEWNDRDPYLYHTTERPWEKPSLASE